MDQRACNRITRSSRRQRLLDFNLSMPEERSPTMVRRDSREDKASQEFSLSNETSKKRTAQHEVPSERSDLEHVKRRKLLHLSSDLVGSSSMRFRDDG